MSTRTVLLVTPGGQTAPGGIARMVDYCVRDWPRDSDFHLRVIDTYGPGAKWQMPFFAAMAFMRVFWLLALGRAQLLHINFSERLSVWRKGAFVMLGRMFGVPVILHLHGAEFKDYIERIGPKRRAWALAILRRADRLIVLGSFWRDFLVNDLKLDPARVIVLCNAVPDMAAGMKRADGGVCRILFLGVVGERKGVPVLLDALASLGELPWHTTIAGNGEIEICRAKAEALGLGARVEFPGLLSESAARAALARADIFVLPSRQEGLPMAILEALSYGCPVVATPVGSIPDAVINGETGLLVPAGDAAALAEALRNLIADATLRQKLSTNARAMFERNFAIAAYNEKLAAIYRELVP